MKLRKRMYEIDKRRILFNGIVGVFVFLVLGISSACAQSVEVVADKTPKVCLDFPDELVQSLSLKGQVADFVDYVQKMTGVKLPSSAESTDGGLIPMKMEYIGPLKGNEVWDTRKVQGYEINVARDNIVIKAHTRLGFQNALYGMLDRWGCRWVMAGPIGEVVPQRDTLSLPVGTIQSPSCYNISVQGGGLEDDPVAEWWRRNQGGREYWLSGQHYWNYAIPPNEYFKDHPEWYALIGEKRVPNQLCTTNPEVIAKMIEIARDFLRTRPGALTFPMDPNDNLDFCQCKKCRALDPPGMDENGQPFMTDRVVQFANEVARAIAKDYPDKGVAFYAYNNHTEPPVNVRPEKNVTVIITRSNYCCLHLAPHKECPLSLDYYDLLKRWKNVCPRIWTYEYDPISWTGSLPCPIYLERGETIQKAFREYGVMGGVTDYVPHFTKSFAGTFVNFYMERRMKADPSRNPREVLSDMCKGFFGQAAEPMEKYYLELARVAEYTHPGRSAVSAGTDRYEEMFDPKLVETARKHLNIAVAAAAKQPPYDERVRLIDLSQQYLESYLDCIRYSKAGDYPKAMESFERVKSLIQQLDQANAIDVKEATRRVVNTALMKTLVKYFPDQTGMARRWKLLGPFDNTKLDAPWRADSFEPTLSIDKPVTLENDTVVHWVDYESPEGMLNLDAYLLDKKSPVKIPYLYAGVRVHSDTARKVQLCMDSFQPFKVYLNGKEVFARLGANADHPDANVVTVDLPKGDGYVVFKLCRQSEYTPGCWPWGVYFRIKDMRGNPIPELFRRDQ